MKNILILCDAFPPSFNPRMGYLCKYLANFDCKPIVITEYTPQNMYSNLTDKQDVTYINYYHSKNRILQKIKYAFVFFAELFFNYKTIIFKREAVKKIKQYNISLILSSISLRPYSALAACRTGTEFNIPFMVDLRDIAEQFPENDRISKKTANAKFNKFISKVITKKNLRQRNRILKKASALTTVSKWHRELLSKYNSNVQLIYNGFDPELFYPKIIKNRQFAVSYTGRIESKSIKDPSIFFEAMANLFAEKKIDAEKFKIQFYLTDEISKKIIKKIAETYKITDFINVFDTVQNSQIPQILNESSILLLLSNKSTGKNTPKGIMGTKLFEYLAVEKPVLCVRNDEACLEETIKNSCAGLAASTVEEAEKFILEKYAEWQQNGYTHQAVKREYIRQFSRKQQAAQFVDVINDVFSKNS